MNFKLRTDRCQDCKTKVTRRDAPGMSAKVTCADCQAAGAVKSRMSRVSGADVPGGSAPFWDDEYLQPEHE